MLLEDALNKIKEDRELAKSFKKALYRGADKDELVGILANAGIGADTAEEVLADYQSKRAAAISEEEVDEDSMRMVAGGSGAGEEECIEMFNECDADIFAPEERCVEAKYCDFEPRW